MTLSTFDTFSKYRSTQGETEILEKVENKGKAKYPKSSENLGISGRKVEVFGVSRARSGVIRGQIRGQNP